MKAVDLLYITNFDEAKKVLGRLACIFLDSGFKPDGNAWLYPHKEIPKEIVERIIANELGHIIYGLEGEYPEHYHFVSPANAVVWTGYQSISKVYWSDDTEPAKPIR